jgi:hypothetical protein
VTWVSGPRAGAFAPHPSKWIVCPSLDYTNRIFISKKVVVWVFSHQVTSNLQSFFCGVDLIASVNPDTNEIPEVHIIGYFEIAFHFPSPGLIELLDYRILSEENQ